MAQEPASLDLSCDDFYLSALFSEMDEFDFDGDQIFPPSDAKYAQGLQLQEAIVASITSHSSSSLNIAASAAVASSSSSSSSSSAKVEEAEEVLKVEFGESSLIFCEICVERKESEMFTVHSCSHVFCNDCISKHVAARLQYHTHSIRCPAMNCEGVIEFDSCRSFMLKDVLEKWGEMLCEELIHASQKFYCPFKDCSAMLVRDTDDVIRESECPVCWRLFCAQCHAPWHPGIECEELLRLNQDERGREDLMLRELAKAKSWNRCPRCKFYVEKSQGCIHMTCRCGFQFCYACGGTWTSTHGGCQPT